MIVLYDRIVRNFLVNTLMEKLQRDEKVTVEKIELTEVVLEDKCNGKDKRIVVYLHPRVFQAMYFSNDQLLTTLPEHLMKMYNIKNVVFFNKL